MLTIEQHLNLEVNSSVRMFDDTECDISLQLQRRVKREMALATCSLLSSAVEVGQPRNDPAAKRQPSKHLPAAPKRACDLPIPCQRYTMPAEEMK